MASSHGIPINIVHESHYQNETVDFQNFMDFLLLQTGSGYHRTAVVPLVASDKIGIRITDRIGQVPGMMTSPDDRRTGCSALLHLRQGVQQGIIAIDHGLPGIAPHSFSELGA